MPYSSKEDQRQYQRRWIKARRRKWILENGPCKKCWSYIRLEVDHIDPRKKLSHAVWSWSKERQQKELKKCQVLCFDCHKKKSASELKQKAAKGEYPLQKLTRLQVNMVRADVARGFTYRTLAKKYSIGIALISDIVNMKRYSLV